MYEYQYVQAHVSDDMSSYSNFSKAEKSSQKVKLIGELVKDKEITYNPENDANYFSFYLNDDDGRMEKVVYIGPKPQDFEMSEKVVVTGKMGDDSFVASEILLKCPSKYKDEEIALRSGKK
jgi:cytochrome c-type biogenesis protein CcmE